MMAGILQSKRRYGFRSSGPSGRGGGRESCSCRNRLRYGGRCRATTGMNAVTGAGMEESPEYVAWLWHREPAYWNWLPGSGTNDPERKQSRQVLMSRYGAGGATVMGLLVWVFW